MNYSDFPKLNTFKEVELRDMVYSPTYGLGEVLEKYRDDELVIEFSDRRIRVALDYTEIPLYHVAKEQSKKAEKSGVISSKKVSFTKLKKVMKRENAEEFVSVKNVAYILEISKKVLEKLCHDNVIEITSFGISRTDLDRLRIIINNN